MKTVNDAVHGMVEIPLYMCDAVATRLFQRLGRISQCGNLRLVWPSAAHTRYAHSIGAAHLAEEYSKRFEFRNRLREAFGLAALLHDVGHGPFSHAFEKAVEGTAAASAYRDHDVWRFKLILHNKELNASLGDCVADVAAIWRGCPSPGCNLSAQEVRVAHALLAGVAGVDRLDYLLRDSYHTSPQHRIDRTAVQAIVLNTSVDFKRGLVEYTPKGAHYVQLLLEARKYMFAEVYLHPRVVSADRALALGFEKGVGRLVQPLITPDAFEQLTDGWVEQQGYGAESGAELIRDALCNRAEQLRRCDADDDPVVRVTVQGVREEDLTNIVNRWDLGDKVLCYK